MTTVHVLTSLTGWEYLVGREVATRVIEVGEGIHLDVVGFGEEKQGVEHLV